MLHGQSLIQVKIESVQFAFENVPLITLGWFSRFPWNCAQFKIFNNLLISSLRNNHETEITIIFE